MSRFYVYVYGQGTRRPEVEGNAAGVECIHSSSVDNPTIDEAREGQRVEFEAGTDPRNPTREGAEHMHLTDEQVRPPRRVRGMSFW
ncbi:MAG TPA: hypothetical protein VLA19_27540 [Herpetosiphonaceae bacterium]|nr:hypothetical protein [Herpetosiphonaceae bacterium]